MIQVIFDIETNGFLPKLDRVHCNSIMDISNEKIDRYIPGEIPESLKRLQEADEIIGHYIEGFDLPAIKKVYPDFKLKEGCIVTDTLKLSKLLWPNLKELDFKFRKKNPKFPGQLIGRHSLEAWGWRLKCHKGDYAKECKAKGVDPWATYNEDMGDYCDNDVLVNHKLWLRIQEKLKAYPKQTVDIEVAVRKFCDEQEKFGVYFDQDAAFELYSELSAIREKLHKELVGIFGSWYVREEEFTPKRNNKTRGYLAGCPISKVKLVEFNPGSRDHIARCLKKMRGWKPKVFTPGGSPKIDEKVLESLRYPEAKKLTEYLMVNKRISQLAEGKQAWLKVVKKDSRIYGQIDTLGTVTGRCSHNSPNLGQIPKVGKPYGEECRKLFLPEPGWSFVGADASGLELRCLGHYMAKWDLGAYIKEILDGDIHTVNQEAAKLPTRDNAKTFIYGFLYGAGDAKTGAIVGKSAKVGKQLKKQFLDNLPALKNLREAVGKAVKLRGYIKAIDGRKVYIRSEHSALNFLLQSCGAIIMKQAMINYHQILSDQGYIHGEDYRQVLHVHDEFQCEVKPGLEATVGQSMVAGIKMVTEQFNFRCPLDGEYKVGDNWAETH